MALTYAQKIVKKITNRIDNTYHITRRGLHAILHPIQESAMPLFVCGLGRGGTTMLINILSMSLDTYTYKEGHPAAFDKYRLKDIAVIKELINKCKHKVVVFKPLQDSHRLPKILDQLPGSKAIWTYRHFNDLVNSTLRTWGNWERGRRDLNLLLDGKGRFSENISDDTFAFFKKNYHTECRLEDAACLMWYLRNILYFEMNLTVDHRVMLVNYEELVKEPVNSFKTVFDFAGCEFKEGYVKKVFSTSVGKNPQPTISTSIQARCENLLKRLDEVNKLN